MLLVDDDEPEPRNRREDRGAGTDDDTGLTRRDPLPLVAPFRLGPGGVQHGDAVAEPGAEPADGLRRERDLGDQHDRSSPTLDRDRARLEVDLRLAGAGGPM